MEGYYDGCIFHRVIKDFMAQTGDPTGTGKGGECALAAEHKNERGEFKDETHQRIRFTHRGLLGAPSSGRKRKGAPPQQRSANRPARDGEQRPGHQQVPVLPHARPVRVARQQAHHLWKGHRQLDLQPEPVQRGRGRRARPANLPAPHPAHGGPPRALRRHRPATERRGAAPRAGGQEAEEGRQEPVAALVRRGGGQRRGAGGGAAEEGDRRPRHALRPDAEQGARRGPGGARPEAPQEGDGDLLLRRHLRRTQGEHRGHFGCGRRRRRRQLRGADAAAAAAQGGGGGGGGREQRGGG
mmetsp:Transcript_21060/g.67865  ORF Transcript_21060/g.67865 Transcript_21060/m.67865 type:complete len:298 (+) Transcript_21060:221-1114(+)